jgi:hypothetical protein
LRVPPKDAVPAGYCREATLATINVWRQGPRSRARLRPSALYGWIVIEMCPPLRACIKPVNEDYFIQIGGLLGRFPSLLSSQTIFGDIAFVRSLE